MAISPLTSVRKEECAAVFETVFGDAREDIMKFYGIADVMPVYEEMGGVIVGIAHVLPVTCGSLHGGYLYAVGVLPAYRGQGVFDRLMQKCEQVCLERDYDFACLIPATAALADTYRRRGYIAEIAASHAEKKSPSGGVVCLSGAFIESVAIGKAEGAPTFGLAKPLCDKLLPPNMHFPCPMGELL